MATAQPATDHDQIREWVEARGGHPARVKETGSGRDPGILRIDFPGFSGEDTLEEIGWDEFFDWFDRDGLALLLSEEEGNRFNKLVSRTAGSSKKSSKKASSSKKATKKASSSKKASTTRKTSKKASTSKKATASRKATTSRKTTKKAGTSSKKATSSKKTTKKTTGTSRTTNRDKKNSRFSKLVAR